MKDNQFSDVENQSLIPTFHAKVLRPDPAAYRNPFGPITIGVFDGNEQIGTYERNYGSMFNTFCPFIGVDGKWYALYSRDYTSTRIMSLPDCKDIGGEEPHTFGFCPTGYYVPIDGAPFNKDGTPEPDIKTEQKEWDDWFLKAYEEKYMPFGFVSGCIWGDDSSDKLEYLDLSRAHEGILVRDARFGHISLPNKIPSSELWRLIDTYYDIMGGGKHHVSIRIPSCVTFHLNTEDKGATFQVSKRFDDRDA